MATVFYRGFYRKIENLRLQCAWSGEVTGKNSKLFRTRFVGCHALPCISIKLWRSTCKPYIVSSLKSRSLEKQRRAKFEFRGTNLYSSDFGRYFRSVLNSFVETITVGNAKQFQWHYCSPGRRRELLQFRFLKKREGAFIHRKDNLVNLEKLTLSFKKLPWWMKARFLNRVLDVG